MSAVISECGTWRYTLERDVSPFEGLTYLYCGVNSSTAGPEIDDQTSKKWRVFTLQEGGSRYIAINPFAYRSKNVRKLATCSDPVGPDNARHVTESIARADIIVPCWGNTSKVPRELQHHFRAMMERFMASGKPIKVFGLTQSNDPMHPLMLSYKTRLVDWITA